ncbi:LysR family transcriptional regulator [Sneathiella glossodoripedis]|uniref:LysR family transcriptional regulator n=1 Tax=Sneathiella glossodoripedis TaxID=418853 RepID=UPI00046EE9EB|nr:LysR family transcriptional regulator [Sneathiella glossodoripedis]
MELREIKFFLAVCDSLNFTQAAKKCCVSQPAMTKTIKKLEDELENDLFFREGKSVLLTEFGRIMKPKMEDIFQRSQSVKYAAEEFRLLHKAPLKIGVMTTIGPLAFSRFLADFKKDNPQIEIEFREDSFETISAELEAGNLELAFLSSPSDLSNRYRLRKIYREKYVVAFPANHHLKDKSSIRLKDLSKEPYVDRLSCEMREMVLQACDAHNIELYATFRSEREDWVQGMVLAELGFAFLPEFSITMNGLLTRPLIDPKVSRDVMLTWMPGRTHSPAASLFMRAAARHSWPT